MEKVFFTEQPNGYDKAQVDSYIRKISEAYQTAYNEYMVIYEKYNRLTQDYRRLESEKQVGETSDIIAKTLLNSERLAKEIIDGAHNEENRIIGLTVKNIQYAYSVLENAMGEVKDFLKFNNAAIADDSDTKETEGELDDDKIIERTEPGISDGDDDGQQQEQYA